MRGRACPFKRRFSQPSCRGCSFTGGPDGEGAHSPLKNEHRCVPPGFPIDARRPVSFSFFLLLLVSLPPFHGLLILSLSLSLFLHQKAVQMRRRRKTRGRPVLLVESKRRPVAASAAPTRPTAVRNRIEGKLSIPVAYRSSAWDSRLPAPAALSDRPIYEISRGRSCLRLSCPLCTASRYALHGY
mgnify:CR=1 FL=1